MRSPALTLTEFQHPATFRSRGVAVPFTTPMLAGARVRESERTGIELVTQNPSGGRGVYILGWPGVQALCSPTLHDTILFRGLSGLAAIDPSTVRGTALAVAAEGYAGHAAASAAGVARANDRAERSLAHLRLLTGLLQQHEPRGPGSADPAEQTRDLDRRASTMLHQLAPSLGRPALCLACDLAAIGDAVAPLGIARGNRNGRIPRLIARLDETGSALLVWLDADIGNEIGGLGRALGEAMRTAARTAASVLDVARTALSDPTALLEHWVRDACAVYASMSRCGWLLDGWERVCLLWAWAASDASRRAALLEMAPLLPVLPREVEDWTDVAIPREAMDQPCHVTSCQDAWRSGVASLGWIERNEHLLAMSS